MEERCHATELMWRGFSLGEWKRRKGVGGWEDWPLETGAAEEKRDTQKGKTETGREAEREKKEHTEKDKEKKKETGGASSPRVSL